MDINTQEAITAISQFSQDITEKREKGTKKISIEDLTEFVQAVNVVVTELTRKTHHLAAAEHNHKQVCLEREKAKAQVRVLSELIADQMEKGESPY